MMLTNTIFIVTYVLIIMIFGQRNNDVHSKIKKLKKLRVLKVHKEEHIQMKLVELQEKSGKITRTGSLLMVLVAFIHISVPEFYPLYIGDFYWSAIGCFIIFGLLLQGVFYIKGESLLEAVDTDSLGDWGFF